jgi:hypothetical protein
VNPRPFLSATAAVSALVLCATTGTAAAAVPKTTPAAGAAASALDLLSVRAGGHTLSLGSLELLSDTLSGKPLAEVVVTPVVADGTSYGRQTVTSSSSPVTVPAQSSPSALAGIATLTSPAFAASATDAPSSSASSSSFGSLSLLGLDVPLDGTLALGSAVSSTTGAAGQKTVLLRNLALPSVADLLAALGLDLTQLPLATLTDLLDQLDLVTSAVSVAQATVTTATSDLTGEQGALATAQATLTTAQGSLTTALAAAPGGLTIADYLVLGSAAKAALDALNPAVAAAAAALTAATAAVATAQAAVTAALAALTAALDSLVDTIVAVLDDTSLLSLDSLSIASKAVVTSNKAGGQTAQVIGGTVSGLKVLGTDVLDVALGSSTVDLVDLAGSAASSVTSTLNGLTGTLSSVLSSAVPGLSIPAPVVSLMNKTTSTGVDQNGFGQAVAALSGLTISIPAITVPTALALPGAAGLPALTGVVQTAGSLVSAPIALDLLTVSDQAGFRPAVTTLPGTTIPEVAPSTPTLPTTGLPAGLAVLALTSIGGALYLRRRTARV